MNREFIKQQINRLDFLMSQNKLTTLEKREKRKIMGSIEDYLNSETKLNGKWEEFFVSCPHCDDSNFVYIYDDNKTCYCLACGKEFDSADVIEIPKDKIVDVDFTPDITEATTDLEDSISDDPELVKRLADKIVSGTTEQKTLPLQLSGPVRTYVPKKSGKTGAVTYGYDDDGYARSCTHTPRHVISGEDWGVWAGKKLDCRDVAHNYDIVLNLTWGTVKEHHNIPIKELQKYEAIGKDFTEVKLDWPDYGAVRLPKQFWIDLIKYAKEHKSRILVFCEGGHGRTGTAVAVMMVLGLGYTPRQAVQWLRKHYCGEAVESQAQMHYIESMYDAEASNVKEKAKVQVQE